MSKEESSKGKKNARRLLSVQDLVVIINALNVFLSVKQIVRIDDILDRGTGEK